MKKNKNFLKKIIEKKFEILFAIIFALAILLRFYNFPNRWGMGNDSTRDIAIAREALSRGEFPLIGSFSSAGPFVFGPLFYWTLMLSYTILPFVFTAPVIFTAATSALTVVILTYCGYLISGKRFALLMALLVATSPQLVLRSVVVGQHTYVAVATALLFLTFTLYWQRKNFIYSFFMGVALGFAVSLHYQSINLLIFFGAVLVVPNLTIKRRILGFLWMLIGFIIPSLPLVLWDSQQQGANFRNILDYLLIAQYRLYVPNSWKLFLLTYLPSYWAYVISGFPKAALLTMSFVAITSLIYSIHLLRNYFHKKQLSKLNILVVFAGIFGILLLVNRFYKGERSEGYLIYLAPFIFLFTAWSMNLFFQLNRFKWVARVLAYLGVTAILIGNLAIIIPSEQSVNTRSELEKTAQFLIKKYPNQKFAIYDYNNRSADMSQSLSLILKTKDKTAPTGTPIGFVCQSPKCLRGFPKIATLGYNYIVDMRKAKNQNLVAKGWVKVNQESMYDDLIGWSKKHELKSTFSFTDYLQSKFK